MKKSTIQKLIQIYGSQKRVAEILGITDRHVRGIVSGQNKPGKPLMKLMEVILDFRNLQKLIK